MRPCLRGTRRSQSSRASTHRWQPGDKDPWCQRGTSPWGTQSRGSLSQQSCRTMCTPACPRDTRGAQAGSLRGTSTGGNEGSKGHAQVSDKQSQCGYSMDGAGVPACGKQHVCPRETLPCPIRTEAHKVVGDLAGSVRAGQTWRAYPWLGHAGCVRVALHVAPLAPVVDFVLVLAALAALAATGTGARGAGGARGAMGPVWACTAGV